MRLYLVRHGQTDWNLEERMQGRKGVGLNETGVKQVEALRDKIKDIRFEICFVSPLQRAVDTARILVGGKCGIVEDERIMERGFGEFEGRKATEYWDAIGGIDTTDRKLNFSEYGVEPIKDMLKRSRNFLNDVRENYRGDVNVLVVAHGALLRALHFEIVGYDDETDFLEMHFENAEMRVYEIDSNY